jgi:hypothetical protein
MNYSRIIGEAPMDMMNPSVMVSRLDLVVLELATVGIDFRRLLKGFWDFRVFIEQRGGGGGTEGAITHQGAPGPPGVPWWVMPTTGRLFGTSSDLQLSSGPKKSTKSFASFGLHLIWIFCKSKTGQKTATGTWHYANRLVPNNDVKLL